MEKFQEYYVDVIKNKFADFSGRARRSEYWYFTLFNIIIILGLLALSSVLAATGSSMLAYIGLGIYFLYAIAMIIPSIAIGVRRLHDTDKPGWWYLVALVPFIGSIILIVFFCTDGTPGENQFGMNPKDDTGGVSDHLISSSL